MATIPLTVVTGQRVSVESDFRVGGVLTDPGVITAYVRSPSAVLSTYTYPTLGMTRDLAGVYRVEFTTTEPGSWGVRFEGSGGGVEAVGETFVQVYASQVV